MARTTDALVFASSRKCHNRRLSAGNEPIPPGALQLNRYLAFRRRTAPLLVLLSLALFAGGAAAQTVPVPQPRPEFGQLGMTQLEALTAVNAHFNGVRTMQGEFIQLGPGEDQLTEGEFYFARPGYLRINYYPPSQTVMIADGRTLVVEDHGRGTQSFYRLSRTPLAPILAEYTDLTSDALVRDVILDSEEYIIVVLLTAQDGAWLTLYFDRITYELRQWVTTDQRGNTTTFVMFETQINQPVSASLFEIENRILEDRRESSSR